MIKDKKFSFEEEENLEANHDLKIIPFKNEESLFKDGFIPLFLEIDPDLIISYEIQAGNLGFLAERFSILSLCILFFTFLDLKFFF